MTSAGDPTPALSEIGVLPAGVTFTDNNDGTATLAGTPGPGTDGVYSIATVAINGTEPAGDHDPHTDRRSRGRPSPAREQAGFTLGQPGSFTVTTTGYPAAALQMNGALPDGLIFTDNGDGTATICGHSSPPDRECGRLEREGDERGRISHLATRGDRVEWQGLAGWKRRRRLPRGYGDLIRIHAGLQAE